MPASLVRIEGWEGKQLSTGTLSGLFSSSNYLASAIQNASLEVVTVHHGGAAIRLGAGTQNLTSEWRMTVGTPGITVVSFMFYLVELPVSSFVRHVYANSPTSGAGGGGVWVDSSGVMHAQLGGDTIRDGPTIAAGQWYRFEAKCVRNANPHTLDWQIDGVAQSQATWAGAATSNSFFAVGKNSSSSGDLIADCFVHSNTEADYPLGEYYVLGFLPDGDSGSSPGSGAFQDLAGSAINAGNVAWDNLDGTAEQTSEGVKQTAVDTAGYIGIGFANQSEPNPPDAVRVSGHFGAVSATACNISSDIVTGSNSSRWASGDPSDSPGHKGFSVQNFQPGTSTEWTDAAFDALTVRIGFSSDANPDPIVYHLLIEAAYLAPVANPIALPIQRRERRIVPLLGEGVGW